MIMVGPQVHNMVIRIPGFAQMTSRSQTGPSIPIKASILLKGPKRGFKYHIQQREAATTGTTEGI